jgi:hypothetical protein
MDATRTTEYTITVDQNEMRALIEALTAWDKGDTSTGPRDGTVSHMLQTLRTVAK